MTVQGSNSKGKMGARVPVGLVLDKRVPFADILAGNRRARVGARATVPAAVDVVTIAAPAGVVPDALAYNICLRTHARTGVQEAVLQCMEVSGAGTKLTAQKTAARKCPL